MTSPNKARESFVTLNRYCREHLKTGGCTNCIFYEKRNDFELCVAKHVTDEIHVGIFNTLKDRVKMLRVRRDDKGNV